MFSPLYPAKDIGIAILTKYNHKNFYIIYQNLCIIYLTVTYIVGKSMRTNSSITKEELFKLSENELLEIAHKKVKEAIKATEKANTKVDF